MKLVVERENERLDKYIASVTDYSRELVTKMLKDDYILVNGKLEKGSYKVKNGDIISIKEGYVQEMDVVPIMMVLDLVFDVDYLMVINKPSGLTVHPGSGNSDNTLVNGLMYYTIGQRKGIGIAAPYPLYVIKIDASKNIVYLGREEDNYKDNLKILDVNLIEPLNDVMKKEFDANVKIRYNMQAKKAHIKIFDNFADIKFYEPVNSVTSGQAGVIYDINDGHLIGGGVVA